MHCTVRELLTPSERDQARALLRSQGLEMPGPVDYGVAAWRGSAMIATGFRGGDVLMGLCVEPSFRGEGVSLSLVNELLRQAVECGRGRLFIFTKPSEVSFFAGIGFSLVSAVPGHAALLEWGVTGFGDWIGGLMPDEPDPAPVGAVVLNANPFTLGHRHLLESAARRCRTVYAFVVEADCSAFPFADRLRLVREGTAHIPQCRVLPGGAYIISLATFPSYFSGAERHAANHAALDLHLFGQRIAPALSIRARFVGTEPVSAVTATYNRTMRDILPGYGIEVCELDRIETRGAVISASTVRARLSEGNVAAALDLVPPTTAAYLRSPQAGPVLERLRLERDKPASNMETP